MVVKELITNNISGFITGIISVIGSLTILFFMNWKLTLLVLIVVPLAAVILVPIGKCLKFLGKHRMKRRDSPDY